MLDIWKMSPKECEDLFKTELSFSLKGKELSFTFDLACRGILMVTRQDNINNWIDEIKNQLQKKVNLKIFVSEKDKLYGNSEIFNIGKLSALNDVMFNKITEPFILLWYMQRTDRFDLRTRARGHPYALFSITSPDEDLGWYDPKWDMRYRMVIIDRDVLSARLYKEFSCTSDIVVKSNSDIIGLKVIPKGLSDSSLVVL